MWRRLWAGGGGRVGKDGSRETRKEATAPVQAGDGPTEGSNATVREEVR